MSLLYFAFANDEQQPLRELQAEAQAIDRLLRPLDKQGAFKLIIDHYATLPEVMRKLALYEDQLVLFHFSGHADSNLLQMADGASYAQGIGEQLGRCRHLQLVVLNGCKTQEQVQLLHDLHIPLVIATPVAVQDTKARQFSETLYESLSYRQPLENAFDHAANRVRALDAGAVIERSLALRQTTDYAADSWQLFVREGYEEHRRWTLPDDRQQAAADSYVPNAQLIDTLAEALSPYNEDLQLLLEREADGLDVELFEKREAIVKCLPHPIGDGIRKLVAQPTEADKGKQEFYDQPDGNRLRQLLLVFEIVIELLAFILLAQLWEEMDPPDEEATAGPPLRLPPAAVAPIRDFLQQPELDLEATLRLIRHLQQLFSEHGIPYFVEEMQALQERLQPGDPFYDSCLWLSRLHRRLEQQPPTDQQGRSLCRPAEEHLCEVLRPLGFVVRYTFASIKNIDLVKYRHRKSPTYQHRLVSLIMNITGLGERGLPLKRYFDSRSVLLLKGDPERPQSIGGALNLTPFIVDENAFNEDARLAKLHFFRRYAPGGVYAYRFIYLLDDLPLVLRPNDERTRSMHRVLGGQFQRFDELLNPKADQP